MHSINSNKTFPSFEKIYSSLKRQQIASFTATVLIAWVPLALFVAKYRNFFFHCVNLVENAWFKIETYNISKSFGLDQ